MSHHLAFRLAGIDSFFDAMNDVVVDAIFYIGRPVVHAIKPAMVGFIFGKEQFWRSFTVKVALPQFVMVGLDSSQGTAIKC